MRRSRHRRLAVLATAALLALAVLAAPGAALADPGAAVPILAVDGDPQGPEPMPRDAEDNPARQMFPDMETPFTWGAAWILTFAGLVGLSLMVLVYVLLVRRPEREADAGRR